MKVPVYVLPKDLPTVEALITLHEVVKKDEGRALRRVATNSDERSLLTREIVRLDDVHTTLDIELSNAHPYPVLAGAISSTASLLYQLVRNYKDFTSNIFGHISKKPFVVWYYADTNVVVSHEVKHCYELYAPVTTPGTSLMKASVDEELNLMVTLRTTIDKTGYIIDNTSLYCFLVTDYGWKSDYIWGTPNSSVKGEIADRVTNKRK